ncbi:OadG family transporter subunit [Cerasicoccus arenae]|uniref:Uncharacterized protein n=1 Tax=Cerasicoccus arenae TaxID=424488 RepID=A0A8J3DBB7_9BACT|nr:OadG family transporter subunit [Cerasicoccus arenae]MBK1857612.1 OadG family protein [Cerasicoccus arenae]GHC05575.1 hypothetical protein GCM10007047_23140 [Cerasicoccus arenae]
MMHTTAIIASLPAHPSIGENMTFIVVGFLFVTFVLLTLAGVTQMISLLFRQADNAKKKPAPATTQQPNVSTSVETTPEAEDASLDPLTAVVIAAAVHAIIGEKPHRILNIRPSSHGWAQEGRRAIFTSHKVR